MTCPNCGWYVRGGARFCPNCGAELPSVEPSRTCPYCDAKFEGDVSLCPNCGAALGGRAAEAAAGEGRAGGATAPPPEAEAPAVGAEAADAKQKESVPRTCPSCNTELRGKVGICPVCGEWLAGEQAPRPVTTSRLKPLSPQWPFDEPTQAEKKKRVKKPKDATKAPAAPAGPEEKAKAPAESATPAARSQFDHVVRVDAAPAARGQADRSPRADAAPAARGPMDRTAGVDAAPAARNQMDRSPRIDAAPAVRGQVDRSPRIDAAPAARAQAPTPERPAESKAPVPPAQPAPARPAASRPFEFRAASSVDRTPEVKPWYVPRSTEEAGPAPAARPAPRPQTAGPDAPAAQPLLAKSVLELLPWVGLLVGIVILSVILFGLVSGNLNIPLLSLNSSGQPTATLAATSASPAFSPTVKAADVTPTSAATPTGEPTSAPSVTPAPRTHVVQAGESLSAIAQKYGVSMTELMAANGIKDANKVSAGQELKIPEGVPVAPAAQTATPALTAAAKPTGAATAMPAGTATAAPTASPVPSVTPSGFEFPAPNLLTPADGAVFRGADDILLNWSSVGLLGDDTWYVVKIWSEDPNQPTPAAGWTRTTAWRIPASSRPAANAASHKMFWTVTVMRAREGQEPVAVSPASATRSFQWE